MLKQLLDIKKRRQKGLKDEIQVLVNEERELTEQLEMARSKRDENMQRWKELSRSNERMSQSDLQLLQNKLNGCYNNEQSIRAELFTKSERLENLAKSIDAARLAAQKNIIEQEKLSYLIEENHA